LNEHTTPSSPSSAATAESAPAADVAATPELAPIEQRLGMMLAHLLSFTGNIVAAAIFWVVTKDENDKPFVQEAAKEVLNFQINVFVAMIICGFLMLLLIGFLLMPLVLIAALILTIIGAIKSSGGELYRYPFIIRLIK